MDYASIIEYFLDSDFDVYPSSLLNIDTLSVCVEIDGQLLTLVHYCISELQQLPHFYLKDYKSFGTLAHILPVDFCGEIGSICVNDMDSVSVNFERPELAFEESIKRHVNLLSKLITDKDFNQSELLREFKTNWYANTKNIIGKTPTVLYCTSDTNDFSLIDIYKPIKSDIVQSIPASFVAKPCQDNDQNIIRFFQINDREKCKNIIGYIFPLQSVDPVIPQNEEGLKAWLLSCFQKLPEGLKQKIENEIFTLRSKEFWLVLNIPTPSGKAWVGVKLTRVKKKPFPSTLEKMSRWRLEPILVDVFNKELMLPRSGANPTLNNKKVLMFGCGSVGSEIAHKLGAAGVGEIDIIDPDFFTTSNLYRHTLAGHHTNWPKAFAVAKQLEAKFPWLKANGYTDYLLNNRKLNSLSIYDVVIVAIGSPTHERLFHDYLTKSDVKIPVIYSWLEGYGIGGHAVLDIPNKKGCLRCAYVDSNAGTRGLASNLNFLASDQNVVKNYAGCGEMFIPYGAISSTQTALIAADLAVNYLAGKLTESTKVSWKGDSEDSKREGLKLTPRYETFTSSLKKQPLRHPLCDICYPEDPIVYLSDCGKRLYLPSTVHQKMCSYKQKEQEALESAGLLIGHYDQSGGVFIDDFTTPKPSDIRTRMTFKLDAKAHQVEIDAAYDSSDQLLGYTGTWHTHPQDVPSPSSIDEIDWKDHELENPDRTLFFIIIGLEKTSVYSIKNGSITELFIE